MTEYTATNILDLMESLGEDEVKSGLSGFSCSKNKEIENFLHNNAIEFAKKKMSITYLVYDDDGHFVAYFTLTHKPVIIREDVLSNRGKKKLSMHARFDKDIQAFNVSAFLIAQFGKNDNAGGGKTISGNYLMELAFEYLKEVQRKIGGGVVFLECEDELKLLEFYQNEQNGFREYGERYSESDHVRYKQLLRFF